MSENETPGAVQGTTVTWKMMVDGTLRISFDVQPRDLQTAIALFGTPGAPVAIARITPEAAQRQAREDTIQQARGGVLAKLAGQFCADIHFQEWLRKKYYPEPQNEHEAAEIIRRTCKISSRADLDHLKEAADIFHNQFRIPYNVWLKDGMP